MILTNARILTFDAAQSRAGFRQRRSPRGRHHRRRCAAAARADADAMDAGRPPADARADQLPHASLQHAGARHRAPRSRRRANFPAILKKLWWRLDRALNEDDVYYSALVGLIDSARMRRGHGDRSPLQPQRLRGQPGSHRAGVPEVGLRGATCYETSDRNGSARRRRGDCARMSASSNAPGRGDGLVRRQLRPARRLHAQRPYAGACVEANQSLGAGFHMHVAEDALRPPAPSSRLRELGILDERTLAAHCIHVDRGRADSARAPRRQRGPQSAIELQ